MGKSEGPSNEVQETALSREQLKILRNREKFLNSFSIPELKDHLENVKQMELRDDFKTSPTNQILASNIAGIRDSFQATEDNLSLNLAKRGMEGSGIEAQSLTQLAGAEAQAVGNAVTQSALQSILEKNNIINQQNQNTLTKNQLHSNALTNLLRLSPTATTAAPQQMMQTPGQASPVAGALGGAMAGASAGATIGSAIPGVGTVVGGVAGGVIGAGASFL